MRLLYFVSQVSAKLSIPISEQTLMAGIKRLDGPGVKLVQHGIYGDCRLVVLVRVVLLVLLS